MKVFGKAGFIIIALIAVFIISSSMAMALTAGQVYTVSASKVNSDGTVASAAASSSATADSDGKITFSLSGIPNNSACNFLVLSIEESSGTTVRRSIVPCPADGAALPAGVSDLTNSQTDALLAALEAAGTDDPILAVFGLAIVRSTSINATELAFMASMCNQGINNTGGFISHLTTSGVTTAQIALYRAAIISKLADTSSGYSKLIKDSVDASSDSGALDARGEAASVLLQILVEAATDAGFSQDRILEAFNAMGDVVMPVMDAAVTAGTLGATTKQMIDSSIGGGIQKLKADKDIQKYAAALTLLGASGTDVTDYQAAATTLMNAMTTAFQAFEQVFDGTETDSTIQAAQNTMDTAMQAAFNQFLTDTAAIDSRIVTMILNIESALGLNPGDTGLNSANFKFYQSNGSTVNWPLTMVILTDWISSVVTEGGEVTYTRDSTAVPSNYGDCDDNQYYKQSDCTDNGGTWTARARTDYGPGGQSVPTSYATIFWIQEDIMILEFVRWAAQEAAGQDMGGHTTLEKAFS
nr:hypothetical protein [bacterium]